ncbi:hypothetical protein Y032_0097g2987 [Ancylostoma ceylanicum]|uniref:Uncharacterized protein n=1 Tax=Ancylostoma ceylanicum TaxID=53326 RepID=A0A016TJK7_9BILA|nr:hypothetical protein Y032_0097g2987 [Ancylostoma ceylanicum]
MIGTETLRICYVCYVGKICPTPIRRLLVRLAYQSTSGDNQINYGDFQALETSGTKSQSPRLHVVIVDIYGTTNPFSPLYLYTRY